MLFQIINKVYPFYFSNKLLFNFSILSFIDKRYEILLAISMPSISFILGSNGNIFCNNHFIT